MSINDTLIVNSSITKSQRTIMDKAEWVTIIIITISSNGEKSLFIENLYAYLFFFFNLIKKKKNRIDIKSLTSNGFIFAEYIENKFESAKKTYIL